LIIIIALSFLIFVELYIFLPGFLGAITLYILGRQQYLKLTEERKWNKSRTALLFMLVFLLVIALPVYYAISLVVPKISSIFTHSDELLKGVHALAERFSAFTGQQLETQANIQAIEKSVTGFIPTFLNSTANLLSNLLVMFFVLFFMFVNGRAMEESLHSFIPLSEQSIEELAQETMHMVRANAIGIPLISVVQGIAATLGYLVFGLKEWAMWGFLTGVFAFFPIIGTMIVWLPLAVYMYSQGMNWQGTGLVIYSLLVTGNVDYMARISLMKKIGNVHPLITIFGVIVGLKLFGFMGFIFGPLIFSYLIILVKIYSHEYSEIISSANTESQLNEK
jgi:predicted PurR-regulated permease PerM